jgi:biotin--protein ligase
MFSQLLRIPKSCMKNLIFVQYLVSLALVETINSLTNGKFPVHLKWPNDIYVLLEKTSHKIAGTIVTSTFFDNNFEIIVGCGVNLDNSYPSLSLNEAISMFNEREKKNISYIKGEVLLANFSLNISKMLPSFIKNGFEPFLDNYYDNWMHSNALVTFVNEKEGFVQVEERDYNSSIEKVLGNVNGITSDGFLSVITKDGLKLEIHPQYHSFDLTNNMIIKKR